MVSEESGPRRRPKPPAKSPNMMTIPRNEEFEDRKYSLPYKHVPLRNKSLGSKPVKTTTNINK